MLYDVRVGVMAGTISPTKIPAKPWYSMRCHILNVFLQNPRNEITSWPQARADLSNLPSAAQHLTGAKAVGTEKCTRSHGADSETGAVANLC